MEFWTCPHCGSHRKHYNSRRDLYVCDSCGSEDITPEIESRKVRYLRTVNQAKEHLSVANWASCLNLVRPLLNEYPRDEELYLLMLAAITRGYEDYLLYDSRACLDAAEIWEKLKRLHCINSVIQCYTEERCRKIQTMRNNILLKTMSLFGGAILCAFIGITIIGSFVLLGLALIVSAFLVARMSYCCTPFSCTSKVKGIDSAENPFGIVMKKEQK